MRAWPTALWLGAVLGAPAAALPVLPSLSSYFLADDFGLIAAFAGQPLSSALALFVSPWITIYGVVPDELRPLLALSYMIDARWGAGWPVGYHATNIGLHVLIAWLV